jgi:hypothetical protein
MFDLLRSTLTLLIGPTVAVPAPLSLADALLQVEVTHRDDGHSGFQLRFAAGRSGPFDALDYGLVANPLLKPFNRVILVLTMQGMPRVLMDGIITHQELAPGSGPGTATLSVTGEDVSVMMDLEEKSAEHPAQDETIIATKIIASYAKYGLVPMVIPPVAIDPPLPIERTPVQQDTDRVYLTKMAERHGYVFYVEPGPVPFTNTAYWGPPPRLSVPQRALNVNLGGETNVTQITFRSNGLSAELAEGAVQDRTTNSAVPVQTFASLRPPLASQPAWLVNQPNVRRRRFRGAGLNAIQALGRAQGRTDASIDGVTADGEVDTLRYGSVLQARALVGLRGAGYSYDGFWYVKRVTHTIRRGAYAQRFSLAREGVGSTTPVVMP